MADSFPTKYESINTLIMAAEAVERADLIAKNKYKNFSFEDDVSGKRKCRVKKSSNRSNYFKEINQNSKLKEEPAFYEKDFSNEKERRYEDINSNNKQQPVYQSENLSIYEELNNLRQKLIEIKSHKRNRRNNYCINSCEDEETSTASEDEAYNKYVDGIDDITDDASECEESYRYSQNQLKPEPMRKIKIRRKRSASNLKSHNISDLKRSNLVSKNGCTLRQQTSNSSTIGVKEISPSHTHSKHSPRLSVSVSVSSSLSSPFIIPDADNCAYIPDVDL